MSSTNRLRIEQLLSRSSHYKDPILTTNNIVNAMEEFPNLKPGCSRFVVNDGKRTRKKLICLRGTIPVSIRRRWSTSDMNISVVIWLQTGFPVDLPLAFLTPKEEPQYGEPDHPFIGLHGELDLWELTGNSKLYGLWDNPGFLPATSCLSGLIGFLIKSLSGWPPIYFLSPHGSPLLIEESTTSSQINPSSLSTNTFGARLLARHHYSNSGKAAKDVKTATKSFPNLKLSLKEFVYNNNNNIQRKTGEMLLTLSGTLRIVSRKITPCFSTWLPPHVTKGRSYDVPFLVWIPKQYPFKDPIVYVDISELPLQSDENESIDKSYFDVDGRINLFKAIQWGSAGRKGSLKNLICKLIRRLSTSLHLGKSKYHSDVVEESSSEEESEEEGWPDATEALKSFRSALKREGYKTLQEKNAEGLKPFKQPRFLDDLPERTQLTPKASSNVKDGSSTQDKERSKLERKVEKSTQTDVEIVEPTKMLNCDAESQTDASQPNLHVAPFPNDIFGTVNSACSSAANSQRLDLVGREIAISEMKVESLGELIGKIEEQVSRLGSQSQEQQQQFPFGPSFFEEEFIFLKSDTLPPQNVSPDPDGNRSGGDPCSVEDALNEPSSSRIQAKVGKFGTLNVPISVPGHTTAVCVFQGTLLAEVENASVKICWTKNLATDEPILSCSFIYCGYCLPFGCTTEQMNDAYEKLVKHIETDHKEPAERLGRRIGKQPTFQCSHYPACKLLFADVESRDRHQSSHLQFSLRGRRLVKKRKMF